MAYDKEKQRLYRKVADETFAEIEAVKQPWLERRAEAIEKAKAKYGNGWAQKYRGRAFVSNYTRKLRKRFFSEQRRLYKAMHAKFAAITEGTYREAPPPTGVCYPFVITGWWLTASGNWRRARTGTWPSWVDRIVVRMPAGGMNGELRVFGRGNMGDIFVEMNGQTFMMPQVHYPRGIGHGIDVTDEWLRLTFPGIHEQGKWDAYSG